MGPILENCHALEAGLLRPIGDPWMRNLQWPLQRPWALAASDEPRTEPLDLSDRTADPAQRALLPMPLPQPLRCLQRRIDLVGFEYRQYVHRAEHRRQARQPRRLGTEPIDDQRPTGADGRVVVLQHPQQMIGIVRRPGRAGDRRGTECALEGRDAARSDQGDARRLRPAEPEALHLLRQRADRRRTGNDDPAIVVESGQDRRDRVGIDQSRVEQRPPNPLDRGRIRPVPAQFCIDIGD